MAKRKTKPKAKTKRPRAPRPRTWLKDERGVPLTDNRRPFAILPSDLLPAMVQPPGTPTKATHEIRGDKPTTAIPELKAIEFTEFAFQSVNEAIQAADQVQIERMNPTGGANLGSSWRNALGLKRGLRKAGNGSKQPGMIWRKPASFPRIRWRAIRQEKRRLQTWVRLLSSQPAPLKR